MADFPLEAFQCGKESQANKLITEKQGYACDETPLEDYARYIERYPIEYWTMMNTAYYFLQKEDFEAVGAFYGAQNQLFGRFFQAEKAANPAAHAESTEL